MSVITVVFIANATGIYLVDTYREITEIDRFWSIGSGRAFALGAMDVLYDDAERDAESIARLGVSAGCKFNSYCSEPIDSFAIALENESLEKPSNHHGSEARSSGPQRLTQ